MLKGSILYKQGLNPLTGVPLLTEAGAMLYLLTNSSGSEWLWMEMYSPGKHKGFPALYMPPNDFKIIGSMCTNLCLIPDLKGLLCYFF